MAWLLALGKWSSQHRRMGWRSRREGLWAGCPAAAERAFTLLQRHAVHHRADLLDGAAPRSAHGHHPVRRGLRQDGLDIIGRHIVAALDQGLRLGGTDEA